MEHTRPTTFSASESTSILLILDSDLFRFASGWCVHESDLLLFWLKSRVMLLFVVNPNLWWCEMDWDLWCYSSVNEFGSWEIVWCLWVWKKLFMMFLKVLSFLLYFDSEKVKRKKDFLFVYFLIRLPLICQCQSPSVPMNSAIMTA